MENIESEKIIELWYENESGNPDVFSLKEYNIECITVHQPRGEGDKWFWTVSFKDKKSIDIFYPIKVVKQGIWVCSCCGREIDKNEKCNKCENIF